MGEVVRMAAVSAVRERPRQQTQQMLHGQLADPGTPQKPRQAQVNARIDAELKDAGDAALAAAGLTPTQAVRMLWSLAARYRDEPERLREALDPDSAAPSADEMAERRRKIEAVRKGASLMEKFFEEFAIAPQPEPDRQSLSEREYYDLLREEHFREKGYIQ